MSRTRYLVAAVVIAGSGLVAGVVSAQVDEPGEQPEILVDQNGNKFPAPEHFETRDGRVPVLGPEGRVGWAEGYDVMGPPPGSYSEDEHPAPPPDGGAPVYAESTGFERVGTLTPSGFVPLGEEIPESTVTTLEGKDADQARR